MNGMPEVPTEPLTVICEDLTPEEQADLENITWDAWARSEVTEEEARAIIGK